MFELIAQGPQPHFRWRKRIPLDCESLLGRECGAFSVPWDDHISRQHASVELANQRLLVSKLPSATNSIFVRGQEVERFTVLPGEHFVIGSTTFTLSNERVRVNRQTPVPITEQTFSSADIQDWRFRDADKRIDVLSRLPEIISGSSSDQEMMIRVINVIFDGVPAARAVAVVSAGDAGIDVLHWDRREQNTDHEFSPSARLINKAVESQETTVHAWSSDGYQPTMTQTENLDWAFCIPMSGRACQSWAIYVAGGFGSQGEAGGNAEFKDDIKFSELVSTTVSALRESQHLHRNMTSYGQFFSPTVLDALTLDDMDEALAPREVDVSVLFCDLRGFSRSSEASAEDLLGLLNRVSDALGVMTHYILHERGVIGDFHGDAAMGFWGWPLAQADQAVCACRAAQAIRREFQIAANNANHPLQGFRVGIGIATGRAVAGKIGTIDQVKVTVFGPVVNLASRLEGLTKQFNAPILIDESTAQNFRDRVPPEEARLRRVAQVRPYQLDSPVKLYELLPPNGENATLSDEEVAAYENALEVFESGDWNRAFELLHQVPASDRVKDYLTVYIAQHGRTPPADWQGVIPIDRK